MEIIRSRGSKAADKSVTAFHSLQQTVIFPCHSVSQIYCSQGEIQFFSKEELLPIMCVHSNSCSQ